jgi:hypothetical protein
MGTSTTTGTLTAGQSRTFNLSPGSALTIVAPPNVRATITETPNTVSASGVGGNSSRTHNLQLGQTVTYGPYPMGGTVVVANASNSGTAITWVRSDSLVAESASGAVSLVDGAGISVARNGNRNVIMFLGDSMVDRNFTATATENSLNGYGSFNHANMLLGRPWTYSADADQGVIGDTTTMILARAATWTAVDCDIIGMSAGTNDYLTMTAAETITNLGLILNLIGPAKPIIYLPCPPRTFVDAATVAKWLTINKWMTEQQSARPNLFVIDEAIDVVVDAASTQFVPLSGVLVSGSAVHTNNAYAFKIGQAIYRKMRYLFAPRNRLIRSAADVAGITTGSKQMFIGGVLAGSGGSKTATGGGTAPTGTVVDSCTVDHVTAASTCTAVCSVVARTMADDGDLIGSNQVIVIGNGGSGTPAIAGDTFQFRNNGNLTVGASPGDTVEAWADIRVSSHSGLRSVALFVQAQVDGGTIQYAYDGRHTASDDVAFPADFIGGIFNTLRRSIPVGSVLTGVQLRVELRFLAGGYATVKIGRPTVINVT